MTRAWCGAIVASLIAVSGCPSTPVRQPCTMPSPTPVPVPVTVAYEPACILPPGPRLEPMRAGTCPPSWDTGGVCFDAAAAAALAARLDALQTWIRHAKAACSPLPARSDGGSARDT